MEAKTDPDKMTVEEFNSAVSKWAKTVEAKAKGKLSVLTSTYSGQLQRSVTAQLKYSKEGFEVRSVNFKFANYGIYIAYGVGRGWNRSKDGSVQVTAKNSKKPRTPKDWLDSVIEENIQDLGDLVGEYYGDKAMKSLLEQFDRIKINKRGTISFE